MIIPPRILRILACNILISCVQTQLFGALLSRARAYLSFLFLTSSLFSLRCTPWPQTSRALGRSKKYAANKVRVNTTHKAEQRVTYSYYSSRQVVCNKLNYYYRRHRISSRPSPLTSTLLVAADYSTYLLFGVLPPIYNNGPVSGKNGTSS